jgi:hypothetical protein
VTPPSGRLSAPSQNSTIGHVSGVHQWLRNLEYRLNRTLFGSDPREAQLHFVSRTAGLDPLSTHATTPRRPRLAIVLTTHRRSESARRLIEALAASLQRAQHHDAFILVLNDRSGCDYAPVLAALTQHFRGRFAFYQSLEHLGKRAFWLTYQHAFRVLERLQPGHSLFLQDDVTFHPTFISDALSLWQAIDDPRKAVLYLCAVQDDEVEGRWIRYRRVEASGGQVRRTQWFDLQAFMVGPLFFELLRNRVFPIHERRWRRDSVKSSGVGEQFTRRLFHRASVYQVSQTLVFHGGEESLMNAEARRIRALDNRPG